MAVTCGERRGSSRAQVEEGERMSAFGSTMQQEDKSMLEFSRRREALEGRLAALEAALPGAEGSGPGGPHQQCWDVKDLKLLARIQELDGSARRVIQKLEDITPSLRKHIDHQDSDPYWHYLVIHATQ